MEAILTQDYENWHCTLVDDASADESPAIITKFVQAHPERFTAVSYEQKTVGSLKRCARDSTARKEISASFVDADDLLFPDFITVHLAAHLYRFNVAFTCSQLAAINGKGQVISSCRTDISHLEEQAYFTYIGAQPLLGFNGDWSATSGMMFRRSVLTWAIPEDTSGIRICADNLLANFANLVGGSLIIQEVLGYYRMHGRNHFSSPSIYGMNACHGNMTVHPSNRKDVVPTLTGLLLRHAEEMSVTIGASGWLKRFGLVAPLNAYGAAFRMRKKLGLSITGLVVSLARN